MRVRLQERAEMLDPVVGSDVREVNPEDVVEDGVVRLSDGVHVLRQQELVAKEDVWDVHVAGAIGVQPEREEGETDVVRRDRGHRRPLEALGLVSVDPGVA